MVKKSIYGYTWAMQRANTLETQHIQGGIDIFPFFPSFPFISFSLDFCGKTMTVLLPNKSVSGHIFQKNKEHVSMLFWQSRVKGLYYSFILGGRCSPARSVSLTLRVEQLVTQMKWRLEEGCGEAIYQVWLSILKSLCDSQYLKKI